MNKTHKFGLAFLFAAFFCCLQSTLSAQTATSLNVDIYYKTYGAALSELYHCNAPSQPGTLTITDAAGNRYADTDVLNAGKYNLMFTYTPFNPAYKPANVLKTVEVGRRDIPEGDAWMEADIPDGGIFYNGKDIRPAVKVWTRYNGQVLLMEPKDYDVFYINCHNATTSAAIQVQSSKNGNYNYFHVPQRFFTIKPIEIVVTSASQTWYEDGKTHKCEKLLPIQGAFLPGEGIDEVVFDGSITEVGQTENSFHINYKSQDDYNNYNVTSVFGTLRILEAGAPISDYRVVVDPAKQVYDGTEKRPAVEVYVGDDLVNKNEYYVIYRNNTNAGTASLSIASVIPSFYNLAPRSIDFTIEKAPISNIRVEVLTKEYDATDVADVKVLGFDGAASGEGRDVVDVTASAVFADAQVGDGKEVAVDFALAGKGAGNYFLQQTSAVASGNISRKTAMLAWGNTEFSYTGAERYVSAAVQNALPGDVVEVSAYTGNTAVNVGNYKATATQLSNPNYKLPANNFVNWVIKPATVAGEVEVEVLLPEGGITYNGKEQTPGVVVKVGGVALAETDYTLSYANNIAASSNALVTVAPAKGGNFVFNEASVSFTINPKKITVDIVRAYDKVYDGNTSASVYVFKTTGIEASDAFMVEVAATGEFRDANAGNGKLIDVQCSLQGEAAANYTFDPFSAEVKANILPKQVDLVWPDSKMVYDGQEKSVAAKVLGAVGGDEVFVSEYQGTLAATNIGSYQTTAVALNSANYALPDNKVFDWIIYNPIPDGYTLKMDLPEGGFVYDGTAKEPVVTVLLNGSPLPAELYQVSYLNNVNAGTAEVLVYLVPVVEDDDYLFNSSFPISPALITGVEVKVGEKTYDGSTFAFVSVLGFDGAVNGEGAGVVNVTASGAFADANAGQGKWVAVNLALTGTGAGNYELQPAALEVQANILKRMVQLSWEGSEFAYDGTEKNVVAVVDGAVGTDVVTVSSYTGTASAVDPGEYTATAASLSNPNYQLPPFCSHNWVITDNQEADFSIVVSAPASGFVYTGQAHTPDVQVWVGSNLVPAGEYSVKYSDNVDAGTAHVVVADNEGGVYNVPDLAETFVIAPAGIEVLSAAVADKVYDGNTSASVVVEGFSGAVNGEDTSVVKVLASGRFANKDAGQGKEVAVRFSLAGSGAGNYVLALPSQTLMASILPKPVSLEWAEAVYGFDGEVHTVSATVSGAVAPDVVLVEEYGGVRSESKVGVYTATAVALNSTNYVVTLGETFNWQIAEGGLNGLAIKWVYPDSVYTYTGQEVEPEFNLVMGDEVIDPSEYKVIFKNNVLAGEAQIVVNDAEGGTYTFAPVTGSFVIAKAWAYVGWNQIPYFEYDGTPKMVDATVYKWDGAAWVENEEVHITRYVDNVKTDTGTYVARAVEINSENYNIASPDTLLWQIAPRQVNTRDVIVYLEEGNFVYNGAEHRPAVLSVMVGDDVLAPSQYKVTYENNVNAGQASVIIADADPKDYYQFNNVVQKFTIQQIEVCLEWETDEFVFDGDPKEVSATVPASSLVEGDVCEVSSYADNVYYASVKTNVGKYMAKANGLSNPNYRLGSTSACYILNWSIKPRTVLSDEIAINVLPYDTVYSATEKTPSVVVMVGDAEVMPNEYHVAYENNLHAGTATVRITDINPNGNYQLPEAVAQFPIKQLEAVLVWSGNDNSYFQGVERKVLATVGNALASDVVNVIRYADNVKVDGGRYVAVALELDNDDYCLPADATKQWVINPWPINARNMEVALDSTEYVYNGLPHTPVVTVKVSLNNKVYIARELEYELTYVNNVDAGKASVVLENVEGGSFILPKKTVDFTITPAPLHLESATASWIYDGLEHSDASVAVTGKMPAGEGVVAQATGAITAVGQAPNPFTYAFADGTNPSNYKVTTAEGTLTVTSAVLTPLVGPGLTIDASGNQVEVTNPLTVYSLQPVATDPVVYNGKPQTPAYALFCNGVQIPETEYVIGYKNNKNAGSSAVVTVTDADGGNYQLLGHEAFFSILPLDVALQGASQSWMYDGMEHANNSVNITSGYIAEGDEFDMKATGSITEVGTAENPVVVEALNGTLMGNYQFETTSGVLSVGKAIITPVVVNGAGQTMTIDPVSGDTVEISQPELTYSVVRQEVEPLVYDGTNLKPAYSLYNNGALIDPSEYQLSYSNNKNAGVAAVAVANADGGNFVLAPSKFSFQILPREIAVESASEEFEYDGLEHSNPLVTVTQGSFVEGDDFSLVATGAISKVGSVENAVSITANGETLLGNYSFTVNAGTLTVLPSAAWPVVKLESADSLFYNGMEQKPAVVVTIGGEVLPASEYVVSYINNKNAGKAGFTVSAAIGGNYSFDVVEDSFRIYPAPVVIASGSSEWVFNGQEHTFGEYTIKGDVPAGEGFVVTVTGAITNVGSVANVFAAEAAQGTLIGNYALKMEEGTLTVVPAVVEPVAALGGADSIFYNGQEQTPAVVVTIGGEALPAGQYSVSYANNKNAGQAGFTVSAVSGGNYQFGPVAGTFTIHPAPLFIESGSHTWVFDGQPHSYNHCTVVGSIAKGDSLVLDAPGSITNVGSVANAFTVEAAQGTLLANYAVTKVEGTLTVEPAVFTPLASLVAADSLFYNGQAHEPAILVTVNGEVLPAGEYVLKFYNNVNAGQASFSVLNAEGGNYNLDSVSGSFPIYPAPLAVKSGSKTWVYDGMEHTCDSAGISGSLVDGEGFDMRVSGAITAVGSVPNAVTLTPLGSTIATNYSITYYEGTLSVTQRQLAPGFVDPATGDTLMLDPVTGDTVKAGDTDGLFFVEVGADSLVYNGKPQMPVLTVMAGGVALDSAEFAVACANNTHAGWATINITDKEGGNFSLAGVSLNFRIYPVSVKVTSCSQTWKYDGQRHVCPDVTVEGDVVEGEGFDVKATGAITQVGEVENTLVIEPQQGTLESDYAIVANNGLLTVLKRVLFPAIIDPLSQDTLRIDPSTGDTVKVAGLEDAYLVDVDLSEAPFVYNGLEVRPAVSIVTSERTLVLGEYQLSYSNNVNAGLATISIANVPNFIDMVDFDYTFAILPREAQVVWSVDTTMLFNGNLQGVGHRVAGLVNGDALNLVVVADSAVSAGCYVAKVADFDNKNYTLANDSVAWCIKKAFGDKPLLTPVAETEQGANDGRILGLNTGLEWKPKGDSVFSAVTDTAMLFAPGDYVVRLAEDSNHLASVDVELTIAAGPVPFAIDSMLVSAFGYCPGTEDVLHFQASGISAPAAYRIIFSEQAAEAGFDSDSAQFLAIGKAAELPFSVPDCAAGVYKAKIQFRSAKNYVSDFVEVDIPVNLSADYITDQWSDVISAVNTEGLFAQYQWYHNDVLLVGENKPYFCEKGGLTGNYFMEVVTTQNQTLRTCKKFFSDPSSIARLIAYPNPVTTKVTIELTEDNGAEHSLYIYNMNGVLVFNSRFKGINTVVDMGSFASETYVVKVDGLDITVIKK